VVISEGIRVSTPVSFFSYFVNGFYSMVDRSLSRVGANASAAVVLARIRRMPTS
jgi:hypothetical protein